MGIQPIEDLENWHQAKDPWEYENNPDDLKRRDVLLSEIPTGEYEHVLDIGCGQGFITQALSGQRVTGVDISQEAIKHAKTKETERLKFLQGSIFHLPKLINEPQDLIIITGVLYPQYIGKSHTLIYRIIDDLLKPSGKLVSVHINEWYQARFPYFFLSDYFYAYREYTHRLEVYEK